MSDWWIRLDCEAAFAGWTSKLPPAQYAAWVKVLQIVKAWGRRGGFIRRSKLYEHAAHANLPPADLEAVIVLGIQEEAVQSDRATDPIYQIQHWGTYQQDRTVAERVARFRANREAPDSNASNGGNVTPPCNDDGTGRDGTGRDTKGQSPPTPPAGGDDDQAPQPDTEQPSEPETPDVSRNARRKTQAQALAKFYRETVHPGDDTCTRSGRGPHNIAALLKDGLDYPALQQAVTNYAEAMTILGQEARYRKNCGNFFGRDKTYEAYLDGNYERPQRPGNRAPGKGGAGQSRPFGSAANPNRRSFGDSERSTA
ncbi:MAG TPA: hypothetical protein VMY35_05205 [Phycisphaerae bacterium]|nr:hypothetical protein [Phycisphaerae bacterium]